MNRQEALEWCVENVKDWHRKMNLNNSPDQWYFCAPSFHGDIVLISYDHATELPITKQNWLDAKAKKEIEVNIDWNKAPEGATHYADGLFYRNYEGCEFYYSTSNEEWEVSGNAPEWLDENLIPRPAEPLVIGDTPEQLKNGVKPQWQNGLPPVGAECEYKHKNLKDWEICKIKYRGKNLTVICSVDEYEFEIAFDNELSGIQFRPLKTQAEIERDKVVSILMCDVAHRIVGLTHEQTKENAKVIANILIDKGLINAGWRPTK